MNDYIVNTDFYNQIIKNPELYIKLCYKRSKKLNILIDVVISYLIRELVKNDEYNIFKDIYIDFIKKLSKYKHAGLGCDLLNISIITEIIALNKIEFFIQFKNILSSFPVDSIYKIKEQNNIIINYIKFHICAYCHRYNYNISKCSGCNNIKYCSQKCQYQDWDKHKKECCYKNKIKKKI